MDLPHLAHMGSPTTGEDGGTSSLVRTALAPEPEDDDDDELEDDDEEEDEELDELEDEEELDDEGLGGERCSASNL